MHSVEEVLLGVQAAVADQLVGVGTAFIHRLESTEEGELPCVCVNYGADAPDETGASLNGIGSALEVLLTAKVIDETEYKVRAALLDLRSRCHKAMSTGLSGYEFAVTYGGADPPEVQMVSRYIGEQTSRWTVRYQMRIDDPE